MSQRNNECTCTIIVPSFNNISNLTTFHRNIKDFITSSKLQDRIIIYYIDGASTDGSRIFLKSIDDLYVKYLSEPDAGIYDAMNKGITLSDSHYIYFMGLDDKLEAGFVTLLNAEIKAPIIYGNVKLTSTGKERCQKFTPFSLIHRNVCHQSMIFSSELLKEYPYSLKYPLLSDWASNIIFSSFCKSLYLNVVIATYNDVSGISSTQADDIFMKDKASLFFEWHGIILGCISEIRMYLRYIRDKLFLGHILKYINGPSLDFGCGAGRLLKLLPEGSVGADLSSTTVQHLKKSNLNAIVYDGEIDGYQFTPFKEFYFESCIMTHVLDHFDNPVYFLNQLFSFCFFKNIKQIIISVPGGRKSFNSNVTHKTFITPDFMREHGFDKHDSYKLQKYYYFPLNCSKIGNWSRYNELIFIFTKK